jgi:hypothetical protein
MTTSGVNVTPRGLDPDLALALAMRALPGGYALLLGSGVSRAAGIPTGWEVVLDLTRRLAAAEGADIGEDPAAWYRQRFGADPDYAELLERLAGTPAERREILRRYFEPDEAERQEGRKMPTRAHRAIAKLVARGYIRVIFTTNFDQLLETALRDEGVPPAVISTADGVAGALPLQHERITVVKLHGDYLDTRLKNTPAELSAYDPAMERLLDRVVDEYGLVVAGWSAVWDVALRAAIERAPNRRLSSFWVQVGQLSPEAQQLVDKRHAIVAVTPGADEFFDSVLEKVTSLEELELPHPVSAAVAVATLKRYLPRTEDNIRLNDLVMGEVERVRDSVDGLQLRGAVTGASILSAMETLRAASSTLLSMLATGAHWDDGRHAGLWQKAIERLGNIGVPPGLAYPGVRLIPALLAEYSAGLGALSAGAEDRLSDILLKPRLRELTRVLRPALLTLHAYGVIERDVPKMLPGHERKKTPMSDWLHESLRPTFKDLLPDDEDYAAFFDRFEYIAALAHAGLGSTPARVKTWGPVGRFAWRSENAVNGGVLAEVDQEIDSQGDQWLLLRAGLFDGSVDKLKEARAGIHKIVTQIQFS